VPRDNGDDSDDSEEEEGHAIFVAVAWSLVFVFFLGRRNHHSRPTDLLDFLRASHSMILKSFEFDHSGSFRGVHILYVNDSLKVCLELLNGCTLPSNQSANIFTPHFHHSLLANLRNSVLMITTRKEKKKL
jgi:hypothetical protein